MVQKLIFSPYDEFGIDNFAPRFVLFDSHCLRQSKKFRTVKVTQTQKFSIQHLKSSMSNATK